MTITPENDVIIVGYGPVGATLAILLAKLGRTVTIIERQAHPYGLPRAVHVDSGAARVLQSAGLGDLLAANSQVTSVYEWRNTEGVTLLRLASGGLGIEGWPSSNMIHQPTIEAGLIATVEASPLIRVFRNEIVSSFDQHADHVSVASLRANGESTTRTAKFVVGCDGANSVIRSLMEVPVVDLGFFFDWLIVDVVLNEPRVYDPENLQVCDPLRPTTVVSGGPGRRRWEFMCLPTEDPAAMGNEARAWELLEPWDVRPDNAVIERHAVYQFQAKWVEHWRNGRVLLAGDAAHLMPPFAGQGLCSGLKDATNLAWKLDHVLRDSNAMILLDTYSSERGPHVRGAIELSVELGKIICVPDVAEAKARDEAMAPMAADGAVMPPPPAPSIDSGCIAVGQLLAGRTFPQGMVAQSSVHVRSDDALGPGWKLVGSAGTRAAVPSNGFGQWFHSFSRTIELGVDMTMADATVSDWFTEHNAVAAIVRPDNIVFGAASDLNEIRVLIEILRTHLN
jgi:2-polyprenyl-6-methoxyphenol hydroxylase-like FAD-dependent oxidoreductase